MDNRENAGKVGKGHPPVHTRFQKGQSGNPKGARPKLPDLDVLIAEVLGADKGGKVAAQKILDALYYKASKGDIRAAEALLNRGYGLPKQKVEVTGKDGGPMEHTTIDL